jgi:hypothetical protein
VRACGLEAFTGSVRAWAYFLRVLEFLLALGAFALVSRWLAAAAAAVGLPPALVSLATSLI